MQSTSGDTPCLARLRDRLGPWRPRRRRRVRRRVRSKSLAGGLASLRRRPPRLSRPPLEPLGLAAALPHRARPLRHDLRRVRDAAAPLATLLRARGHAVLNRPRPLGTTHAGRLRSTVDRQPRGRRRGRHCMATMPIRPTPRHMPLLRIFPRRPRQHRPVSRVRPPLPWQSAAMNALKHTKPRMLNSPFPSQSATGS